MRKTPLAVLPVLLIAFASAAEPSDPTMTFAVPAQIGSQLTLNATWALIIFDGPSGTFSADMPEPSTHLNITETTVGGGSGPLISGPGVAVPQDSTNQLPSFTASLSFTQGRSSLYLEGDSIQVALGDGDGALWTRGEGECAYAFQTPPEREHRDSRSYEMCPAGKGVVAVFHPFEQSHLEFIVAGTALRTIEWHHAQVSCVNLGKDDCPNGGVRDDRNVPVGSQALHATFHGFDRLTSMNAEVTGMGNAIQVILGAPVMDIDVQGWIRLPLATGSSPCSTCQSPTNQTFSSTGNMTLEALQPAKGGGLQSRLTGDLSSARFDEAKVDPSLIFEPGAATVAAATAAGLAILKFLLAPFFTRLTKAEALEHPRRKAIFEHIQRNPGTSFRETARTVGIAAGTVRHHLNVLERAGMVVERPHGATVRFFEQKDSDADWVSVVMLREPPLKLLHDWLTLHPGSPQTGILEAMEEQGWSRSTTQHRLARLVDSGLVAIKLQGRYKMYKVVERPGDAIPAVGAVVASPGAAQ